MTGSAQVEWPRWIQDIQRLLPIRAQFVLSGSIRDVFLIPASAEQQILAPLVPSLWSALEQKSYDFFVIYDRTDGIRIHPATEASEAQATKLLDLKLQNGVMPVNLEALAAIVKRVVSLKGVHAAVIMDFASRLSIAPQTPEGPEHRLFATMEKLSFLANPVIAGPRTGQKASPLFNPVFWLLNREHDIPSWFPLDSERISSLVIQSPDYESRLHAAHVLGTLFRGNKEATADEQKSYAVGFADGTDGMSLQALVDIAQLARAQDIAMRDVDDAVRCFKIGAIENPWKKEYLKDKIRRASDTIEARVKGQHQAVVKTIDILMRSVMGLTGAQASSRGGRPRGVLFFAGPTGVGKTELAKSLTQTLFGDEQSYIRFDMSEFAEEHSSARLLGAPPGYVGYEAGGELTNAVKQKPFSVILFDEIEKCHPRLLDKFLQILEDGRLTDGRGNTVYFSEAVLIFTSNLGIYVETEDGSRIQNVKPEEGYEAVEAKVKAAIETYFKFRLGRPELLNRIGDNIVVFNFIAPDVARQIVTGMLENVIRRVEREHKIELVLQPEVREKVMGLCTSDLTNGGRGIGNRIESILINPLARALFDESNLAPRQRVTIKGLVERDHIFCLEIA